MLLEERIDNLLSRERTFASLCTAFAALALLIACIGLYGSLSYVVSRRTSEIGIRLALGAQRGAVVRMILGEVMTLIAIGVLAGFAAAQSLVPVVKSFFFGVKPGDPAMILLAAGLLVASTLIAGYTPALRASRLDPLAAVRHE